MVKINIKQILFFTSLFAANLAAQNVNVQIEKAMRHYDQLIVSMNTDSISRMYTIDGELGNVAKGRDSIKSFLDRFKAYKVKVQESKTNSILVNGDSAIQKGTYRQITNIPNQGDLEIKGTFTATWVKIEQDKWLLKRMETKNN